MHRRARSTRVGRWTLLLDELPHLPRGVAVVRVVQCREIQPPTVARMITTGHSYVSSNAGSRACPSSMGVSQEGSPFPHPSHTHRGNCGLEWIRARYSDLNSPCKCAGCGSGCEWCSSGGHWFDPRCAHQERLFQAVSALATRPDPALIPHWVPRSVDLAGAARLRAHWKASLNGSGARIRAS